jgi:hypothetical protein
MKRLAAKWEKANTAPTSTVENFVKDAMDTVQSKYDHRGAQIHVFGSVYQARVVIVIDGRQTFWHYVVVLEGA